MSKTAYTDAQACRNAGMPLGGIGAGSLEIRPDGYFHGWYLMNNKPWGSGPETDEMERLGLRFGLRYRTEGGEAAGLSLGEHVGLDPNLDGWFWMSDPYHLPWIRHPRSIDFQASIPFARLGYRFTNDVPVGVSLKAWSPLVPHDAAASNTPGCVLEFTLANSAEVPCEVSLVGLLKNAVGYDRPDLPCTAEFRTTAPKGITLGREGMDDNANSAGTMGLYVTGDAGKVSYSLHTRHGRCLWKPLLEDGRLPDIDEGVETSAFGEIGAETTSSGPTGLRRSALCASLKLTPGETKTIRFLLTWNFPNFTELPRGEQPVNVIGVQYARRFADAAAVAAWMAREHDSLLEQTSAFHDALERTTMPGWFLQAMNATWAVLLRSAWWDYEGRFGIWEGLGCCGLQTVDVGHYASLVTLQLFPELDASQNRLTASNLEPTGKAPHMMPGNFGCSDHRPGKRGRIDLGPQYVLAVWRHALWTGDLDEARRLWPVIKRNLELMDEFDTNGDGLPDNQGSDQTYDRFPLFGVSAYVGFLYLAALRAAGDLAEWLGEDDAAEGYRTKARDAESKLQETLWNGEYYNLSVDEEKGTNTGCMTDQVNADWFWRLATGDPLLPADRTAEALNAVLRHNHCTVGEESWLVNCSWPKGEGIELPMVGSDQVNCPWTGVEYAVASHMVSAGLDEQGMAVVRAAFDRYERAGMRFNHIECGQYYYRMMSIWQVLQARFGLAWNGRTNTLTVAPPVGDQRFVVVLPTGWATAEWTEDAGTLALTCRGGSLNITALRFRGQRIESSVSLSSTEVATVQTNQGG